MASTSKLTPAQKAAATRKANADAAKADTPRTTAQIAAERGAAVPADRARKSDELAARDDIPDGAELLTPVIELRSFQQGEILADLMAIFKSAGIDLTGKVDAEGNPVEPDPDDDTTVEIDTHDPEIVRALGKFSPTLEAIAIDKEKFIAWDRGSGALMRLAALAMWYVAALQE